MSTIRNGDTVSAAYVSGLLRPATKMLNRISDLNVLAITTGQLRHGKNEISNISQERNSGISLIPNTSSIQSLCADNSLIDILYQVKKDLEFIENMVV